VCEQKSIEIERLHRQIESNRSNSEQEAAISNKLITELQNKLEEINSSNMEELECLKVKMAQLFTGDVKTLQNYYENQLL
jgi:hypothetical protein